jgi:mono/diheme cytochrome c family protein
VFLAGCEVGPPPGPLAYVRNEEAAAQLPDRPKLQAAVFQAVDGLFGSDPRRMIVPKGAPLAHGGAYLAARVVATGEDGKPLPPVRLTSTDPATGKVRPAPGGFTLYRQNCLHCHGLSGDGNGPTSAFLWPRPRDFRRGVFKFTSSNRPNKPTRDDLRAILKNGVANTAMPSFEALMTEDEREQVIDYLIFLSTRGETERALINEATLADDSEAATYFTPDVVESIAASVFDNWVGANEDVLEPPVRRVEPTPESLARGRDLYLGRTKEKLECAGCHGASGNGQGPSWIDLKTFNAQVFGGDDPKHEQLKAVAEKTQKKWGDEWGLPLRPANLNQGVYKGGRRPVDLYLRIAKGINGTPMPAHSSTLKPEQIWDVVNFVLALPDRPELLRDVPASPPSSVPVAGR